MKLLKVCPLYYIPLCTLDRAFNSYIDFLFHLNLKWYKCILAGRRAISHFPSFDRLLTAVVTTAVRLSPRSAWPERRPSQKVLLTRGIDYLSMDMTWSGESVPAAAALANHYLSGPNAPVNRTQKYSATAGQPIRANFPHCG